MNMIRHEFVGRAPRLVLEIEGEGSEGKDAREDYHLRTLVYLIMCDSGQLSLEHLLLSRQPGVYQLEK